MPLSRSPEQIVDEDRAKRYGHPFDSFTRIATMWEAILGITITPEQVSLCMMAFKIARCVQAGGYDEDSLVDIKGYAVCLERIIERRAELKPLSIPELAALAEGVVGGSNMMLADTQLHSEKSLPSARFAG